MFVVEPVVFQMRDADMAAAGELNRDRKAKGGSGQPHG